MSAGCLATAPNAARASWMQIPLCFFDTDSHQVAFEFDTSELRGRLVLDGVRPLDLPPRTVPLKVLELDRDRLLVAVRELWIGRLHLYVICDVPAIWQEVQLPENLQDGLFRQACRYGDQVWLVLYDVRQKTNLLGRLRPADAGRLAWDESFATKLKFGVKYGYEYESNVLTAVRDDTLYIASGNACYACRSPVADAGPPTVERWTVPGDVRLIELAGDQAGIVGLYHDREACPGGKNEPESQAPFFLYDW